MATQLFQLTGKKKGTNTDHKSIIKVAGGRLNEEELLAHFKKRRHPILRKVSSPVITYLGDENAEAIDENGKPIPPNMELIKTLDPKTGRTKDAVEKDEKEAEKQETIAGELPPRSAPDGTVGKAGAK